MKSLPFAIAFLSVFLCASAADEPHIAYGPDSLVDIHPSAWYAEPAIAVSPKNSRNLIAGSMVFSPGGLTVETFRSTDGGYDWRNTDLPIASGWLLGDVQAAFGPSGAAYMTVLGSTVDASGTRNGLYVFRSFNDGVTFERLAFLQTPNHDSYDHDQLAVDRTSSPYRGRVYISVLYTLSVKPTQLNALGLLWSDDGGHTFSHPVQVTRGWSFNSRPLVLANGTVLFPFIHLRYAQDTHESVEVSASHDGGASFSKPIVIGSRTVFGLRELEQHLHRSNYAFDADSVPQLAAGPSANGNGTSVYAVWSDLSTGTSRLVFTRSDDLGLHWTPPRAILSSADSADSQYQPSMAVNESGTLGVSWYRASRPSSAATVSEMFAISKDGGTSFSVPVRIASASAALYPPKGDGYVAQAFSDSTGIYVGLTSPLARYPSGGDYMGLDTDSGGAFHPIWIDARDGVNQIWTSTVAATLPDPVPGGVSKHDVSGLTNLEFGIGSWEESSHTFSVPVRLHNTSNKVLYPPFTVTVSTTQNPYFPHVAPHLAFLNADNRKTGVGAAFVYAAAALGNLGRLAPGADTARRIWKIRVPGASLDPAFVTSVTGYLAPP